ncbi:hypothetical protein MTsPCn9_13900 [Croceitalea sp. MTPC9]|uniref:DoxX family protein n=1 Tax=unclassified Croceitalea TaxID=2632280 RepID=UPI002B37AE93|nr:hypothetical protein MTsPCn6_15230 [Croceitalea sp. MTPC6]GMN16454.1 hypothetical protein MTsPCn9_13900 [Croceitalea sp. MTPC9]
MEYLIIGIKILIFISIINVWFLRFNKTTPWRGSDAQSMKDEFQAYGLSTAAMYLVGGLKVISALLLIVSIWIPMLTIYAAGALAILMLGAIIMHIKVNDPLKKSFPAFSFLVLSLLLVANSQGMI